VNFALAGTSDLIVYVIGTGMPSEKYTGFSELPAFVFNFSADNAAPPIVDELA
jgi:hypothetical protein